MQCFYKQFFFYHIPFLHQGPFEAQYLAQGHFGPQRIKLRPSLLPEQQLSYNLTHIILVNASLAPHSLNSSRPPVWSVCCHYHFPIKLQFSLFTIMFSSLQEHCIMSPAIIQSKNVNKWNKSDSEVRSCQVLFQNLSESSVFSTQVLYSVLLQDNDTRFWRKRIGEREEWTLRLVNMRRSQVQPESLF